MIIASADFGLWTLVFGLWTLVLGLWTLVFGLVPLDFGLGSLAARRSEIAVSDLKPKRQRPKTKVQRPKAKAQRPKAQGLRPALVLRLPRLLSSFQFVILSSLAIQLQRESGYEFWRPARQVYQANAEIVLHKFHRLIRTLHSH